MDISSMLNPPADDAPMEVDTEGKDFEQQRKMEIKFGHDSYHYHQARQYKPTPVEVGGYQQAYPTPANSPDLGYIHIAAPSPDRRRSQYLPSFQEVNQRLFNNPSPQITVSSMRSEFETISIDVLERKARQFDGRHRRTAPTSRYEYRRPQSAPIHGHRVTNGTHESLRRSSNVSRTSIQKLHHLQKAQYQPPPPPPGTVKLAPHPNQPYPAHIVDWMRYRKIDLAEKWQMIADQFKETWPGERKENVTKGGLSSRFYRDNYIPALDINGNLFKDNQERLMVLNVQVRTREKGEYANTPWTFVERHPWLALQHPFISNAYKADAARIIAEIEAKDPSEYTRKQQYIVKIKEFDEDRSQAKAILPVPAAFAHPSTYNKYLVDGKWVGKVVDPELDSHDDDLYEESRRSSQEDEEEDESGAVLC